MRDSVEILYSNFETDCDFITHFIEVNNFNNNQDIVALEKISADLITKTIGAINETLQNSKDDQSSELARLAEKVKAKAESTLLLIKDKTLLSNPLNPYVTFYVSLVDIITKTNEILTQLKKLDSEDNQNTTPIPSQNTQDNFREKYIQALSQVVRVWLRPDNELQSFYVRAKNLSHHINSFLKDNQTLNPLIKENATNILKFLDDRIKSFNHNSTMPIQTQDNYLLLVLLKDGQMKLKEFDKVMTSRLLDRNPEARLKCSVNLRASQNLQAIISLEVNYLTRLLPSQSVLQANREARKPRV